MVKEFSLEDIGIAKKHSLWKIYEEAGDHFSQWELYQIRKTLNEHTSTYRKEGVENILLLLSRAHERYEPGNRWRTYWQEKYQEVYEKYIELKN